MPSRTLVADLKALFMMVRGVADRTTTCDEDDESDVSHVSHVLEKAHTVLCILSQMHNCPAARTMCPRGCNMC